MVRNLGSWLGLLVVSCVFVTTGCKQNYNGALTIGTNDYEAVKEYHRLREERMVARERAATEHSKSLSDKYGETTPVSMNGQPVEKVAPPTPPVSQPDTSETDTQPGSQSETDPQTTANPDDQQSVTTPWRPMPSQFVSTQPQYTPNTRPETTPSRPVDIYGDMPGDRGQISSMDSTNQVRRISFTEEGADFDVTIDKSGEYLVYSSTRHRQTSDIYRQRVDGSAITQLTEDASNDVMPAISPDGKTIAFASDRSGNWDIYLMDANGGPAVQLTSDRTHDISPSFSPDGKKIVYCSMGERSGQWQLVTIDVENPTTKRYIGHGLFPQWSPKGDTIVYQRARERGTRWFSVWTVELDERGEAGSPTEIVWSSDYACITPSWSPDGKAVVFCTVMNPDADTQGDKPAESDVWIARADGSGRTRMTGGRFANLQPVWSGDNAIYFVSNRSAEGVENIWAIDPNDAVKVAFPNSEAKKTNTADVPTDTD